MLAYRRRVAVVISVVWLASVVSPTPARAARGGPDAGGWLWADSNEAGIDTSHETGPMTLIASPLPDDGIFPIDIAFPFTLYGTTSMRLYGCTRGFKSPK